MAEKVLPFKVSTPTGVIFDGSVQEVTAHNSMGEFGVLPEHTNYITALGPCVITVKLDNGQYRLFVVSGGLVEIKDGSMTVLATTAENAEDLTAVDALSGEVLAAEEKLLHLSFYEPGYENAVKALQFARGRHRGSRYRA